MRHLMLILPLALATLDAHGAGPKPCEELRSEIAAKLDARGVVGYTLEIVAPGETGERKVVGRCDGGTHRIVYLRQPTAVDPPSREVAARTQ
jgi:hypothetical protein